MAIVCELDKNLPFLIIYFYVHLSFNPESQRKKESTQFFSNLDQQEKEM